MKGVNHYKKDGTLHKGGMHKMGDGSLHSGKSHTKTSQKLFHYGELKIHPRRKQKLIGITNGNNEVTNGKTNKETRSVCKHTC